MSFVYLLLSHFVSGVTRACKQVSRSKCLKTLFEVILCFGNYMNKGSRANASGFKVSSLNKIIDTKSSNDKRITLLHFILTVLEKKVNMIIFVALSFNIVLTTNTTNNFLPSFLQFPIVFNLEEELPDVRNAAKVK